MKRSATLVFTLRDIRVRMQVRSAAENRSHTVERPASQQRNVPGMSWHMAVGDPSAGIDGICKPSGRCPLGSPEICITF